FVQAEDGIRDRNVTGVQTCALPIYRGVFRRSKPPRILPRPSTCRTCRGPLFFVAVMMGIVIQLNQYSQSWKTIEAAPQFPKSTLWPAVALLVAEVRPVIRSDTSSIVVEIRGSIVHWWQ